MNPRRILIDIAITIPVVAVCVYGLSPWMGIFRAAGIGTCAGLLAIQYREHRQELAREKKKP